MEKRKRRRSDRAGRPAMRSPGRPPVAGREEQQRFWQAITRGLSSEEAAVSCGVSPPVGGRWFREGGGMPPISLAPRSARYLSFAEREEIAILSAQGAGVRDIARRLRRAPSTVSRELRRNAATRSGGLAYRASAAQCLLGDDKGFCLHPHLLLESPVGYGQDRPTSPLRSIAMTAPSSLLRATPSQCLASVLRFLWGRHLNGSLRIETTGSRSSIEKPGPGSCHLHAGHRLGRLQGTPQTSPDGITLHRFRCHVLVHDESTVVHLRSSF